MLFPPVLTEFRPGLPIHDYVPTAVQLQHYCGSIRAVQYRRQPQQERLGQQTHSYNINTTAVRGNPCSWQSGRRNATICRLYGRLAHTSSCATLVHEVSVTPTQKVLASAGAHKRTKQEQAAIAKLQDELPVLVL